MRKDQGKRLLLGFLLGMFMAAIGLPVFAQEAPILVSVEPRESNTRMFTANATIEFQDLSYANGAVFFSYHILAPSDGSQPEMLRFENERVFISPNEAGIAELSIAVDARAFPEKLLYIAYDIVDEGNVRWLSQVPDLPFDGTQTAVRYNRATEILRGWADAIGAEPFIALLNGVALVGFIFLLLKIRRILPKL